MREIDDRYPEFARPWEPVKGGKHYKKLRFAALPLTAAVLAVIGLTVQLPKPEPVAALPAVTETVEPAPYTEPPAVSFPVSPPPAETIPENDPDTPHRPNRYDPRGYPEVNPPVTIPPVTVPPVTAPPVTYPPVTNPPVTVPPVTNPPVTYQPIIYPPVTDPPVTVPPVTDPPVTVPPVTDPPVTVPPVTDPPVTVPPVTDPPVTVPPVTDPPVTDPPVTDPPVTVPPVTDPPVTDPPVTDPPVTDPPVTDPPVTDPPVTDPPVTDPPVTDPPVTDPPVTDPPVTDPPVTDPPVTDPPVTDPPVTDPPVTDPPVTDPPVTDPPVTHEEPITEVGRHVEYEEMDAGTVFYSVELKDLKGGSAKATLHRKTDSGWEALSGTGTSAEKSFAEDEEYWSVNDYGSEYLLYYLPPLHDDIGAADTLKVVFDYTYPDGTTGTYESDPLPFHNGTYATPNIYYAREGWEYIWTTNDLIFDVLIRNDLVDESKVEAMYTEVYDEDAGVRVDATPTITKVQDDSGDWHMIFTYHFDEMLHEGNFSFYTALHYPEDAYNDWDVEVDMSFAL